MSILNIQPERRFSTSTPLRASPWLVRVAEARLGFFEALGRSAVDSAAEDERFLESLERLGICELPSRVQSYLSCSRLFQPPTYMASSQSAIMMRHIMSQGPREAGTGWLSALKLLSVTTKDQRVLVWFLLVLIRGGVQLGNFEADFQAGFEFAGVLLCANGQTRQTYEICMQSYRIMCQY